MSEQAKSYQNQEGEDLAALERPIAVGMVLPIAGQLGCSLDLAEIAFR